MFSVYFAELLRFRKERTILGVFEVFLGISKQTKEKNNRALTQNYFLRKIILK